MEIITGKTAGFCFGVTNAVSKSKEALKKQKNLYCLGELVHNKDVTEELEKEGIKFVNNIEESKENVIIRAHGEPKETYSKAKELNINVLDLTCPKVTNIHKIAEQYAKDGYYIILIGQTNHPETKGTISYCGVNNHIIESEEEIEDTINAFEKLNINKLLIIVQTTFSTEKFEIISNKIKERINKNVKIEIKNTICSATKERQEETKRIAQEVDLMIIIGGKHSSNTNKLYNIATEYCKETVLIENEKELNLKQIKKETKVGIMAGASTPEKSIKAVVELLNTI